jgi:hypothetical protein
LPLPAKVLSLFYRQRGFIGAVGDPPETMQADRVGGLVGFTAAVEIWAG